MEPIDDGSLLSRLSSGKNLIITGGEPLLRKDILNLISIAKKSGTRDIELQTNGTMLYYPKLVKNLADSEITLFNVAMPSHIETINDILTQQHGLYNKRIRGIKNLLEYGANVRITMILNKLNAEHMSGYARFVSDNFPNIQILEFNLLKIMGRAEKRKWLMPRISDIETELMNTIKFCRENGINFLVDGIPLCHLKDYENHAIDVLKILNNKDFFDGRIKTQECENCSLTTICRGFREGYMKIHGSDEAIPSKKSLKSIKKFFR